MGTRAILDNRGPLPVHVWALPGGHPLRRDFPREPRWVRELPLGENPVSHLNQLGPSRPPVPLATSSRKVRSAVVSVSWNGIRGA